MAHKRLRLGRSETAAHCCVCLRFVKEDRDGNAFPHNRGRDRCPGSGQPVQSMRPVAITTTRRTVRSSP